MFTVNLHNPLRPTYRIHGMTDNLWMALDLPDNKGNAVTVFIQNVEELRALVEVSREALVQLERRIAILAALNEPIDEAPVTEAPVMVSLEKALGPVGSF